MDWEVARTASVKAASAVAKIDSQLGSHGAPKTSVTVAPASAATRLPAALWTTVATTRAQPAMRPVATYARASVELSFRVSHASRRTSAARQSAARSRRGRRTCRSSRPPHHWRRSPRPVRVRPRARLVRALRRRRPPCSGHRPPPTCRPSSISATLTHHSGMSDAKFRVPQIGSASQNASRSASPPLLADDGHPVSRSSRSRTRPSTRTISLGDHIAARLDGHLAPSRRRQHQRLLNERRRRRRPHRPSASPVPAWHDGTHGPAPERPSVGRPSPAPDAVASTRRSTHSLSRTVSVQQIRDVGRPGRFP